MNPFREDLVSRSRAEPCSIVIFGATGDLTHRKLIPALNNLAVDGELQHAAGAGVQIQDVNRLLNQFDQMQQMMKKMKGGGLMKMMKRMGGMKGMMPPGFPGR